MNHLKNNADKPAYPVQIEDWHGLTKREHFAYGAMVALITAHGLNRETLQQTCFEVADLMLKEGQK
jgi:hypothetical protein